MIINATADFYFGALGFDRAKETIQELRWRSGGQRAQADLSKWDEADLEKLLQYAEKNNKSMHTKVTTWMVLRKNPTGAKVSNLQQLEAALESFIGASEHKFLFTEGEDEVVLPWLVVDIQYHRAYTDNYGYHPAHTDIDLECVYRDEEKEMTISWKTEDLYGRKTTVDQLLANKGLYLESKEAFDKWEAMIPRYHEICKLTGVQFIASGFAIAQDSDSWWRQKNVITCMRDGFPTKVLIDDEGDPDKDNDGRHKKKKKDEPASIRRYVEMWDVDKKGQKHSTKERDEEDTEEDKTLLRPIHPYVQVFSLDTHTFMDICVTNIEIYKYSTDLDRKLILPAETKELVNVLVANVSHRMEDIVSGKTGGIIVIATGFPGTGKTLTAEVYSESIEKPLYMVQCAQLGTDEEELEEKLTTILSRAERWGAILLIDEADVYVRARENDIQQNAIVGVFLRLLERFQGVLFMTSNRETAIDDAIMSRAIAHIKYELPTSEDLKLIWEVLAANYGIELYPKEIVQLVEALPGISGRNVKTLLKLAKQVREDGKDKNSKQMVELIKRLAKFVALATPLKKAEK